MTIIRNIVMFIISAALLFFALTAGLIVFGVLIVLGIAFLIYFKLRNKEIINDISQMGMHQEPPSPTIDGDYEVVEAEFEVIDDKEPVTKDD